MRPAVWSPLAATDPLPGDPAAISVEARRLRGFAEMLQEEVRRLHGLGRAEGLVGEYADTLRLEATKLADRLSQIVGRHEKTAELLDRWHPQLESFQSRSLQLLRVAQAARESQLTHEIPGYGNPAAVLDVAAEQHRLAALDSATATVETARRHLAELLEEAEAAAALVARDIQFAIHDGVKDGGWDNFKDWVGDHADTLTTIADRAGDLATVAAIAVCIGVPGVNVLTWTALGLTALGAVDHVVLASVGEGSWSDVGLDAFALATFGTGKLAARGMKSALDDASTAGEAAVRTETVKERVRRVKQARDEALRIRNDPTVNNAARARASQAVSKADSEVRRAGTEAANDFRARPLPVVTRREAAMVGGDRDLVRRFDEVKALQSRFPVDTNIRTAAERASDLYSTAKWSWRAGAGIDTADKFATYEADALSDRYKELQQKTTREVGSTW